MTNTIPECRHARNQPVYCADLVALPSVNPMGRPLQGPELFEERVTDYPKYFFRDSVWPTTAAHRPLRDNIVAVYEPPNAVRTLVFEAHQDTVPTDNMTIEPFGASCRERSAVRSRRLRY